MDFMEFNIQPALQLPVAASSLPTQLGPQIAMREQDGKGTFSTFKGMSNSSTFSKPSKEQLYIPFNSHYVQSIGISGNKLTKGDKAKRRGRKSSNKTESPRLRLCDALPVQCLGFTESQDL